MNSTEFCYWLKGYFELSKDTKLSEEQSKVIKEHLDLVFNKVTKEFVPAIPEPTHSRMNELLEEGKNQAKSLKEIKSLFEDTLDYDFDSGINNKKIC